MFRVAACLATAGGVLAAPLERWVYAPVNHLVPAEIDRIEALMRRARPLGYTHFLVADSKFARLAEMEQRYFANVERVRKTAGELGLGMVPAVFPVGYSNDILWHDPNLAEGLPVKDALFVVEGGEARVVADPPVSLPPLGERRQWDFIDEPWQTEGEAVRAENPGGKNIRLMKTVKVAPFRHYHVSARIRTREFRTPVEIKVLTADGRSLTFTNSGTKPTQDWRTHHVTFNSLENAEIKIYIGAWGAGGGAVWIAEPAVAEAGPVNLLRRAGCPLKVRREGGPELREGLDFEALKDLRMGNQPYAGEFEIWHDAPPIRIPEADGTRLRVSYFHTHIVYDGQVCACASEPAFVELLRQQARDVHRVWQAGDYMMSHDEWRVMGWDDACRQRGLDAGEISRRTRGNASDSFRRSIRADEFLFGTTCSIRITTR
jgi:hypothetical protein